MATSYGAHRLPTQIKQKRIDIFPEVATTAALSVALAAGDVDTAAKIATELNATNAAINAILTSLKA